MSTAKRSRPRQSEASAASSHPPSKKTKTSKDSHVPAAGLHFLTDEISRAGKPLRATTTKDAVDSRANRLDETNAVVGHANGDDLDMKDASSQQGAIEITSGESESDVYDSSEDKATDVPRASAGVKPLTNGMTGLHGSVNDNESDARAGAKRSAGSDHVPQQSNGDEEGGPFSFGDLLQASHPETVDVQAAFADRIAESQALVPVSNNRVLEVPSATSLGTVLTQALRTNDRELLESCFQMTDVPSIRSTIQRLQSPLVGTLLQRLAERLHKRPGRAGGLMVWVQWSLVAHGGYLAGQPEVMRKLRSLSRVVKERASGLQSLMTLKGKLDMLSAQIELRRNLQGASRDAQFDPEEENEAVIYVEGEDDESSDDEAEPMDAIAAPRRRDRSSTKSTLPGANDGANGSDGDEVDDVPMTNGLAGDLEDESSANEDEEQMDGGLIDDEAEETSDDEGEESSEADDSDEEIEADEETSASDSDNPPPAKAPKPQSRSTLGRKR